MREWCWGWWVSGDDEVDGDDDDVGEVDDVVIIIGDEEPMSEASRWWKYTGAEKKRGNIQGY